MYKITGKAYENGKLVFKKAYVYDLQYLNYVIDSLDYDLEDGRYIKIQFVFCKEEENEE